MQPAAEGGSNRRMLFFSRSRADLGLTLIVSATLALLTLVLFKLDDDVQLVSSGLARARVHAPTEPCSARSNLIDFLGCIVFLTSAAQVWSLSSFNQ